MRQATIAERRLAGNSRSFPRAGAITGVTLGGGAGGGGDDDGAGAGPAPGPAPGAGPGAVVRVTSGGFAPDSRAGVRGGGLE